jgi:hypothetical protein
LTLHNPDGLTGEQVGIGWRLLTSEEFGKTFEALEIWEGSGLGWAKCTAPRVHLLETAFRIPSSTPWPKMEKVDPFAELKKAHAEGKLIQWRNKEGYKGLPIEWEDVPVGATLWLAGWDYRIKPEPVYVPLEISDVPPGSIFSRFPEHEYYQTMTNTSGWVSILEVAGAVMMSYMELKDQGWQINRSIPLTGKWNPDAWQPCRKEAK